MTDIETVHDEIGIIEQKLEVMLNQGTVASEDYAALTRRIGFLKDAFSNIERRYKEFEASQQ